MSTGGYTTWNTKTFTGITLPKGTLRVRVYIEKGGLNINWLRFYGKKQATEQELQALEPDTAPERNHLVSSDCEYQGAWQTASLASINNAKYTWNSTSSTPSGGSGGALCISAARSHSLNTVVYQPVEVVAGHVYAADVAVRGASGNGEFWIQAFMVKDRPKDYADSGLDEANTIGQLNSWKDGSLATYDGMMSAKAKAGSSHGAGVMKWKATATGTVYFALKVGTNKTSFSYSFDNFTLTDLTDIETGIEGIGEASESIGQASSVTRHAPQIYNISGQPVGSSPKLPGIYIIPSGKQTRKVVVR